MTDTTADMGHGHHYGRLGWILAGSALAIFGLFRRFRSRRRLEVGAVSESWIAEHVASRDNPPDW